MALHRFPVHFGPFSMAVIDCFSIDPENEKGACHSNPEPPRATPPHLLCPRDIGHTPTLSHPLHVRIVQMDYDLKNL